MCPTADIMARNVTLGPSGPFARYRSSFAGYRVDGRISLRGHFRHFTDWTKQCHLQVVGEDSGLVEYYSFSF